MPEGMEALHELLQSGEHMDLANPALLEPLATPPPPFPPFAPQARRSIRVSLSANGCAAAALKSVSQNVL